MTNEYKEQNIPLVNVSGILLGACALGYDSAYCMYRLYLSSGFSAGKTNNVISRTLQRDASASITTYKFAISQSESTLVILISCDIK